MDKLFGDLEGVGCYEDDLCVWSTTIEEHMERLEAVFNRARDCGLRFNKNKCEFLRTEMTYLGHVLTAEGLKVDDRKVSAIKNMPTPKTKQELQRFLGMVTYLMKFIPDLSTKTAPLRQLLEKDCVWQWTSQQDQAVQVLKDTLSSCPTLRMFDVKKPVTIECDSSKDGLGAVLLQEEQPVAYASRSLTAAEERYAQIEKETLAIVFALERFHQYVYGRKVEVLTDHKPIVAIVKKPFSKCPPRIQRFLLRMQNYDINVTFRKGKEQILSDTLSRATEQNHEEKKTEIPNMEVEAFVDSVVKMLYASPEKLKEIKEKQVADATLTKLRSQISEWPENIKKVPKEIRQFWTNREDITECDGILLKGNQIIIPDSMKSEMLAVVHQGHLGIELSQNRAKTAIYWPGMLKQIEETVSSCGVCQKHRNAQQRETLQPHEIPDKPWIKVATDLFHFNGKDFLLVSDYYSKYFEINQLKTTTSETVIQHLKIIFARHGIPIYLVSDNGPQYSSNSFRDFMKSWDVQHITSSPAFPQSNGFIERNVQTVKRLLKKAYESKEDPNIAIMNYRATPKSQTLSPAELLMGRPIRTLLPSIAKKATTLKVKNKSDGKVKKWYDRKARDLKALKEGEFVRYRSNNVWEPAQVISQETSRSYNIKTATGNIRRNRQHLLKTGEKDQEIKTERPIEHELYQPHALTTLPAPETTAVPVPCQQQPDSIHNQNRPRRQPRIPNRLKDYVLTG